MKYKCSNCGEEHEDFPALGFLSPHYYYILTEEDKQSKGELTEDICVIKHEEQTDRFIRGVLVQPIKDACQDLNYGLWVSLSEKNYQDYIDNFNSAEHVSKRADLDYFFGRAHFFIDQGAAKPNSLGY